MLENLLSTSVKKKIINKVESEVFMPFAGILKRLETETEKGVLMISINEQSNLLASIIIFENNLPKKVIYSVSINALLNQNEKILKNATETINRYLIENNI